MGQVPFMTHLIVLFQATAGPVRPQLEVQRMTRCFRGRGLACPDRGDRVHGVRSGIPPFLRRQDGSVLGACQRKGPADFAVREFRDTVDELRALSAVNGYLGLFLPPCLFPPPFFSSPCLTLSSFNLLSLLLPPFLCSFHFSLGFLSFHYFSLFSYRLSSSYFFSSPSSLYMIPTHLFFADSILSVCTVLSSYPLSSSSHLLPLVAISFGKRFFSSYMLSAAGPFFVVTFTLLTTVMLLNMFMAIVINALSKVG
eukprot:764092-Hanusia_phi.AAC.4